MKITRNLANSYFKDIKKDYEGGEHCRFRQLDDILRLAEDSEYNIYIEDVGLHNQDGLIYVKHKLDKSNYDGYAVCYVSRYKQYFEEMECKVSVVAGKVDDPDDPCPINCDVITDKNNRGIFVNYLFIEPL